MIPSVILQSIYYANHLFLWYQQIPILVRNRLLLYPKISIWCCRRADFIGSIRCNTFTMLYSQKGFWLVNNSNSYGVNRLQYTFYLKLNSNSIASSSRPFCHGPLTSPPIYWGIQTQKPINNWSKKECKGIFAQNELIFIPFGYQCVNRQRPILLSAFHENKIDIVLLWRWQ